MFTGIIQNSGFIDAFEARDFGATIRIRTTVAEPFEDGESVAINGVCLTVVHNDDATVTADVSRETLNRTTLGHLGSGARVNVERSLELGQRIGGHIVQGHVDAVGTLLSIAAEGDFATYRWGFPVEYASLIVNKGSVAVDGISLTVVDPDRASFGAALIPETLRRTNLGAARVGDQANLEFDLIAKYVRNFTAPYVTS